MELPKNILSMECIKDWCILLGYRGSIAHGTYRPNSEPNSIDDIDLQGVCIPPIDYYYGLKQFGSRGTMEIKQDEYDIVLFELTKTVRLLEKGNPNVLSILWLDPKHYLKISKAGQMLLDNRDLFTSKQVYRSFAGYANGQLKRMTHLACKGYMGEKRKRLVEKYGYDTKNASHLIRILELGIEFLHEGVLHVHRNNADKLLEIKDGKWSLGNVKVEAERLFRLAEVTYNLSKLPDKPDHTKVNELCVNIAKCWLGRDHDREAAAIEKMDHEGN